MAVDGTASLDLKRGDWGQLADGLSDARPICDGKLLSQGCFELWERYRAGQYKVADDRSSHALHDPHKISSPASARIVVQVTLRMAEWNRRRSRWNTLSTDLWRKNKTKGEGQRCRGWTRPKHSRSAHLQSNSPQRRSIHDNAPALAPARAPIDRHGRLWLVLDRLGPAIWTQ